MVEAKLTVPVDSVVPFADVPKALAKSLAQANAGKIVVDLGAAFNSAARLSFT